MKISSGKADLKSGGKRTLVVQQEEEKKLMVVKRYSDGAFLRATGDLCESVHSILFL